MKNMKIEIALDKAVSTTEAGLYSLLVNGEIIMSCLGEEEVKKLTVSDIIKWAETEV